MLTSLLFVSNILLGSLLILIMLFSGRTNIKENENSYFKGSYGTAVKKGSLNITSDYGGIKLTHN